MPNSNRLIEAFKENFNVLGLATAASVSAATLNPLPLLLGLVAEAAYLLFVPDSKWYEARLARRFDEAVEQRRRELRDRIFPSLRPEMRERFKRLEQKRRDMDTLPLEGQQWFREVLRKLDYLLEKFLMFASKEIQFRNYLSSVRDELLGPPKQERRRVEERYRGEQRRPQHIEVDLFDLLFPGLTRVKIEEEPVYEEPRRRPRVEEEERSARSARDVSTERTVFDIQAHYDRERAAVKESLEVEQEFNTKAVLEKRLEVLQRRHEFVGKIGQILKNLNHQLELLEDTFGLISDEIRARPPEQVIADIDNVVWQTNTLTQLLEEIAPYERAAGGG